MIFLQVIGRWNPVAFWLGWALALTGLVAAWFGAGTLSRKSQSFQSNSVFRAIVKEVEHYLIFLFLGGVAIVAVILIMYLFR